MKKTTITTTALVGSLAFTVGVSLAVRKVITSVVIEANPIAAGVVAALAVVGGSVIVDKAVGQAVKYAEKAGD